MSRPNYLGVSEFFNVLGDDFYTEEFFGPLDSQVFLDIDTGKVYLEVFEQHLREQHEGEPFTVDVAGGVYELMTPTPNKSIHPDTYEGGPGSWEMEAVDSIPANALKVPRPARGGKTKRLITDTWEPGW